MEFHRTSGLSPRAIQTTRVLPGQREWSRPKDSATKGVRMFTEDVRSEETLPFGLGYNVLQHQTRTVIASSHVILHSGRGVVGRHVTH